MIKARPRAQRVNGPLERSQLLATVALATVAYLPLGRFLDWQVNTFIGAVFLLRVAAMRWPRIHPGRLALLVLTLAGLTIALAASYTLPGQRGGTGLFVIMLALKLLELRDRRDLRVVAVVIGFLVVVQFLFDQSLGLACYMGLVAVGMVILLVDLNGGLGIPSLHTAPRIALGLCVQALPLTLVLFLLFPRLSAPLWGIAPTSGLGHMGMSERLEPGAISELVVNGDLAFRARFKQSPPSGDQLYWRGLVLWQPDARGWSPGIDPAWPLEAQVESFGPTLDYEVLLGPTQRRWLFTLDLPIGLPEGATRSGDFQLLAKQPLTTATRYQGRSSLNYRTSLPPDWVYPRALSLPPNVTERMRLLAAGWQDEAGDPWPVVLAGLRFFNREAFHYTLLPPRLGANPTDEFLFETRRGFCEHFASSFAVLMRLAGVPSRIVLGYLGGEPNRLGGYHMVWQSDAHAWVEVLIPNRGWVRVDPTAAVDPTRVDNRAASELLGTNAPLRFEVTPSGALLRALRQARLLADSLEAAWQTWVLDFSADQQRSLLQRVGLEWLRGTGLAVFMALTANLVLALSLWGLPARRPRRPALELVYDRFCERLARAGLPRRLGEGPKDYAERVAGSRPDLAAEVGQFTVLYIRQRYAPDADDRDIVGLERRLRVFRPRRLGSRH